MEQPGPLDLEIKMGHASSLHEDPGWCAGGTLEQGLALLDWAETCPNLPQVAAAQQWFGWTNATAAVPCSWSGVVRCDAQLLGIGLPYTGISCEPHLAILQLRWPCMHDP